MNGFAVFVMSRYELNFDWGYKLNYEVSYFKQ